MSRATHSDRRRGSAGFTIIEALVALAVVAASLAAIGALVATSARGARKLEAHVAMVETARAVVAGLPKRDELALGSLSGELAGHRWRVDVLPFAGDPAAAWQPQAVVVTVRSPAGGMLRLDTVRLRKRSDG